VVRLSTRNTYWLRIGLGSIALHLAFLSTFSAVHADKPVELMYLPNVQVTRQVHKASPIKATRAISPTSGSTQTFDNKASSPNTFGYLRESLYKELDEKLKNRRSSSELVLLLKFSSSGTLEQTELLKSSGRAEVDSEVLKILETARLYTSPDFANLKIQVPVTLR
jgi:TonB family protein